MKKTLILLGILLVFAFFQVFAAPRAQTASKKNYVEGQLLVKFKDGPYAPTTLSAHEFAGATVLENFDPIGWQLLKLPDAVSVEEGMKRYAGFSECLLAQPNFT